MSEDFDAMHDRLHNLADDLTRLADLFHQQNRDGSEYLYGRALSYELAAARIRRVAGPVTPDEALRDAWLAEMWKPCRELSRAERMEQREADAMAREALTSLCISLWSGHRDGKLLPDALRDRRWSE